MVRRSTRKVVMAGSDSTYRTRVPTAATLDPERAARKAVVDMPSVLTTGRTVSNAVTVGVVVGSVTVELGGGLVVPPLPPEVPPRPVSPPPSVVVSPLEEPKLALADAFELMVSSQLPVPPQLPPQPSKLAPEAGVAVSVTDVPGA